MSVVLVVLVLIAALAVPSIVSLERGQASREFLRALPALAREGREEAITTGIPHAIRYDDALREISLVALRDEEEEQAISSVWVPEDYEITRFVVEDNEANAGDWQMTFYPDGKTDGGGLEAESDGQVFALEIRAQSGTVDFYEGELPPPGSDTWTAGDYEQRS